MAGDELDEAIVQYMKRAYNLMIGERTAEEIKIKIGSAYPIEKETSVEVKGRDLVAGLPKTLTITSQEVREALLEPISTIVDSVAHHAGALPAGAFGRPGRSRTGPGRRRRAYSRLRSTFERGNRPAGACGGRSAERSGGRHRQMPERNQVFPSGRDRRSPVAAVSNYGLAISDCGLVRLLALDRSILSRKPQKFIRRDGQSPIAMSRTNIIALLIFGAILGYFLSFGPDTTQKFKTGVYQLWPHF